MSSNAGVLAYYEKRASTPTQFIPRDVADVLVKRLIAERISNRVIRLLHPRSVFCAKSAAQVFPQPFTFRSADPEPINLEACEIPGLRFLLDADRVARWRRVRRDAVVSACMEYEWE